MSIYDDFDKDFDVEGLKKDLNDVAEGGGERKQVPHDVYEVKITKLELTKSKKGDPMVTCWFKIVAGEYKGQMIFMNRVISNGFGLHKCNDFLKSISSLPVTFDSFKQYSMLLTDIMEETEGKYEYQLNYSTEKNFDTYTIEEVFEVK